MWGYGPVTGGVAAGGDPELCRWGDPPASPPIDRVAADRPFSSGKHKRHGMILQVIASPDGIIPVCHVVQCRGHHRISPARPSESGAIRPKTPFGTQTPTCSASTPG